MAFISNSLGVTCLHCHTDVYESDEKPMKDKARQMIRLTRAINEAQFGGRRVITCQTCHNGRAVPDSTPKIEDAGWNKPPREPDRALPSLASVLQRYGEVAGVAAIERLAGTSARGVNHRLYFDESTGLLVRRTDEIETPIGAVPERYDFSDFRRVDGVMVPTRIVWSRADYQVTFAVSEIGHNVTPVP